MDITSFADLLVAARSQRAPQRLLFVFAQAGLPADATPEQKARHARGEGGELTPVLCVDKRPEDLKNFEALARESEETGQSWDLVFVAAMNAPASPDAVDPELKRMVQWIETGRVENFLAFNRQGEPVRIG